MELSNSGIDMSILDNQKDVGKESNSIFNISNGILYGLKEGAVCPENLIIPDEVTEIADSAFANHNEIKTITLGKRCRYLGDDAFSKCENLTYANLNNCTFIDKRTFANCIKLETVLAPEVKSVGNQAFWCNYSLTEINLPKCEVILPESFYDCRSLKTAQIPHCGAIQKSTFYYCNNLTNVVFSEKLLSIEDYAFAYTNLEAIILPKNLYLIGEGAFEHSNAKIIKLNDDLVNLGIKALNVSRGDKKNNEIYDEIILPKAIKIVGYSSNDYSTKEKDIYGTIKIPKLYDINQNQAILNNIQIYSFAYDNDFTYVCTSEQAEKKCKKNNPNLNFIPLTEQCKTISFNKYFNNLIVAEGNTQLLKDKQNYAQNFIYTYSKFLSKTNDQKISMDLTLEILKLTDNPKNLVDSWNFKYLNRIFEKVKNNFSSNNLDKIQVVKMMSILGGFSNDANIRQKAGEFILQNYDKMGNLGLSVDYMNSLEFNPKVSNFILNTPNALQDISSICAEDSLFFKFICEKFDDVQLTHTSNKGNQRKLQPTCDYFYKYYKEQKDYKDDKSTSIISKYFFEKEIVDRGKKILEDFKTCNAPPSLVKNLKPMKDSTFFDVINMYQEKINENAYFSIGLLNTMIDRNLTYEWLKKDDATNLILGKMCDCCAHLEGVGYGIARASVLNNHVQNLVIKKGDKIIAKSTLYINPEQGYGVFNTVEISDDYLTDSELIYTTFKRGVIDFAENYNLENPDKKLKLITCGTDYYNDVLSVMTGYDKQSSEILECLDYAEYGEQIGTYSGNWSHSQHIVWMYDELRDMEKQTEVKTEEIKN